MGAIAVSAGGAHTCALINGGTIKCWGSNSNGSLGDGSSTLVDSSVPVDVPLTGVLQISSRGSRTFALRSDGTVWGWGNGTEGLLGSTSATSGANGLPIPVADITNITKVTAGYSASCALRQDGTVWCWGPGTNGQVGDGAYTTRGKPVQVSGLTGAIDIASGGNHVCALLTGGSITCWGFGGDGQLGDGLSRVRDPVGVRLVCP